MVHLLCTISKHPDFHIYEIFVQTCFHIFLIFWYIQFHKYGSPGGQNPEIMKMLGFGPSHYKTEVLLDQNRSEEFPGAFEPII